MSRQAPRQAARQVQGIPISGLRDMSNGPTCGDCAGRVLEKRYPVDGWRCPMCRRIWFRPEAGAFRVQCIECGEVWQEEEGHTCPKIPTPRRREAVMATREKLL